jgi:hypothetical protein
LGAGHPDEITETTFTAKEIAKSTEFKSIK